MSGKYALIIGNNEYTDSGLAQLRTPGKDAEDFARVLKDKEIGAFDDVKIIVNEPSASVIEAIDEFFDQKKPDDMLVLYFSGHGIRDEIGSLYLAFQNTIRSRLRSTAIKSDYVKEAMDQSRSKRQVLILDCCNSGAFPQGTKAELGGSMGMTKAFQGYGRFVLTASDATQFAWEGDKVIGETDNSLFTHFLVKGLEGEADNDGDGRITVDELYDYTFDQISRVTPKQTPTKSSSKVEGEIVLRQSMRIEDIKPVDLPDDLINEIEDLRPSVREWAVQRLEKIIKGKNIGMARSAMDALEKIATDENTTRRVSQVAMQVLESYKQAMQKAEEERLAKLEAERLAEEKQVAHEQAEAERKAEEERIAKAKLEAERKAKEEAERLAAQKTEEERITKAKFEAERVANEKIEVERKSREEAERLTKQKAEEERVAKVKIEAERFAEEKRLTEAKAEAERKAREESDRLAAQKAEEERVTKANIDAERLTAENAEAERKAKEETERLAKQRVEEERIAKAKKEADRLAKEKRLAKKKADAEQKAKVLSAHETAEKVLVTPRNIPSPETKTQRQQPTLKWIIIGVIGLCILGTGAWGISYLAGLVGPAPTEKPATTVPGSNPPVTTESPATEPVMVNIQHGTLRVNAGTLPDTLDPQKSSVVNEIGHLNKIYEGLTKLDANLVTIPAAANSWEYSSDATVLTFTIREGIVYSDGSVLNAERFAYSIKRNIDPATAGVYASITDEIKGAPEWRSGDATAQSIVNESVKASRSNGSNCTGYDDTACNTLTLTFSKPASYFHTVMSIWVAYPAKQENIEAGGETWWQTPEYQIGNGGWILKTFAQDIGTIFVSNTNYYGGEPYYDIEYKYISDSVAAFDAYKNNELDVISSAAEDFSIIDDDPDLKAQHKTYPSSCTTVIKFNLNSTWNDIENPFTDKKVREAFALAFDTEGWVRDVDGNLSSPTWTWIPPGYPGYDVNSPLRFNVEAAKAALAASSYSGPDALNALGLKLTFGDTPRNLQRSEWLVANYKDNLGVNIELDPVDNATFTNLTRDPATFPLMTRQGWCADYPDPQNWLSVYWKSDTAFAQRQGYNNSVFDSLVNQAGVETDPAKRIELYAQAQQLLLSDIPAAFGYNALSHYLVKPWVKGYQTTSQDLMYPGDIDPTSIYIDASMIP